MYEHLNERCLRGVGCQVCMQISRDFNEHDSETTGSERAQQEHEICIHTTDRQSAAVPLFGGWRIVFLTGLIVYDFMKDL